MEIVDLLRHAPPFAGLADEELHRIVPLCRRETYPPGQIIGREGAEVRSMYIVESGCVALEMTIRWGPGGTAWQWPIEVITPGQFFAWSALVKPHVLTATSRPLIRTDVIAIDGPALRDLLDECPRIGRVVMEGIAEVVSSRLRSARRTAAQSVAIFSHDLKTPLAAVEYFNQVILGGYAGPLTDDQREMLERSSQRIQQLLELLNDLLEAAQIEKGLIAPELCQTQVASVVRGAVDDACEAAAAKGITLSVHLPDGLGEIQAAPKRVERVLSSLLSNAIRFTPPGGVVEVRVTEGDGGLQFEVVDTGVGIPTWELPLVFGDCYRGQAGDDGVPGTGMGLAIARRIVEAHGGAIWGESPPRGRETGSRFAFVLPRCPAGGAGGFAVAGRSTGGKS